MTAVDPQTSKRAERPVDIFITVPFPEVLAPTLTVDQPGEGATFENGAIPVQGTTANAKTVTVSAAYTGGETRHRRQSRPRPRLRLRRRPPTSATTARSTSRSS